MSYDEHDAAIDAFYDEMREQLYPEIIAEFTTERLQSYFLLYPEAAKQAHLALNDSLRLQEAGFFSAAFLFSVIATEVAVKTVLLKPIVHGLVHNLPTSSLIAGIVLKRKNFEDIKKLLFKSLSNIAGVDLGSFRRAESNQILWEEITSLQTKRNKLMHGAQMLSSTDAEKAIAVASAILNDVFPAVINAINLHLHEHGRICNDSLCALEGKVKPELIEKLRNQRNSNAQQVGQRDVPPAGGFENQI